MSSTIDDSDTPMASTTDLDLEHDLDHDLDPDSPLDPGIGGPDTPPPTSSQSIFPTSSTTSSHAPSQSTPHLSSASFFSPPHPGMETPPPSAAMHPFHSHQQHQLMTPGPTGTPPSSQQSLSQLRSEMGIDRSHSIDRGSSVAELWVTAGWGGKKLIEEYELQRDKLLDSALDLSYLGDDYDESEMWQ